jgi:hypothetical protein
MSETVVAGPSYYPSIVIDAADVPHIAYEQARGSEMRYAWLDGSTWLSQTVDGLGDGSDPWTSLALDRDGAPRITYHAESTGYEDASRYALRYAWFSAGSWHTMTVDAIGESGKGALAIDSRGYPHVAYYTSYPTSDLRYAGGEWATVYLPLVLKSD